LGETRDCELVAAMKLCQCATCADKQLRATALAGDVESVPASVGVA